MKHLLYKEFKLAVHPIVYVFVLVFPLMTLIPSYPLFISMIYVCAAYPILFLGSNKGQQSNDIFYSCLLPVSKKDIVKARMLTVVIMQFVSLALICVLSPLKNVLLANNAELQQTSLEVGLTTKGIISLAALMLVGYSFYDLIYFEYFYKNGRSVLLPTLLGMLVFSLYGALTVIYLPLQFEAYRNFFECENIGQQFLYLAVSLVIYFLIHFLTYKTASKRFEKVDF